MFKWTRQSRARTLKARVELVSERSSHAVMIGLIALIAADRLASHSVNIAQKSDSYGKRELNLAGVPAEILSAKGPATLYAPLPPTNSLQQTNARPRWTSVDALKPADVVNGKKPEQLITAKSIDRDSSSSTKPDDLMPSGSQPQKSDDAALAPPAIGIVRKSSEYTVANVWSKEDIAEARQSCASLFKDINIVATEVAPVKEGACGAPAPVEVHSLGTPKVSIDPPAMLTCPMAAALHKWIADKVQPAALATFGSPVVRLTSASSYVCRNRYGKSDAPLSEHALANALDLSGFVLADGRAIRVLESWGPVARDEQATAAKVAAAPLATSAPLLRAGLSSLGAKSLLNQGVQATQADAPNKGSNEKSTPSQTDPNIQRMMFLHKVHQDACELFGTVLGPEANDAHRNHFHLDMKARRHTAFCQ